jgi:hypothetical protein
MPKRSELTLVCPNLQPLLETLVNHSLVIRASSIEDIASVSDRVGQENHLHCVVVQETRPLSNISLKEERWKIPLLLVVPEMGDRTKVLKRIAQLREWNARVFMSGARAENLTSLRILSSLGIPSGLLMQPPLDWDAVDDLMHYAMYTRTPHADIDPFGYVKSVYTPQMLTYLGTPLFDNPLRYVHMDGEGNIALSDADLRAGRWIGHGAEALTGLTETEEYRHAVNDWQKVFLEDRRCAYCPAWRLCQGSFLSECERDEGVLRFFTGFLEAADAAYAARQAGVRWQP